MVEPEGPEIRDPTQAPQQAPVAGHPSGSPVDRSLDSEAALNCLTVLLQHHILQLQFLEGSLQLQSNKFKR